MPKKLYASEGDLALALIAHLRARGWEIYEEVGPKGSWGRADVVAVKDDVLRIIECKLQMGFPVLTQAGRWSGWGDEIWVAVPRKRSTWKARGIADKAIQTAHEVYGVGVIEVSPRETVEFPPPFYPPVQEKRRAAMKGFLSPELQGQGGDWAKAGTTKAQVWTPFKQTVQRFTEEVAKHPEGIPLLEALAAIEHHYKSDKYAARNLVSHLEVGKLIPGVRLELRGRKRYVLPAGVDTTDE